MVSSQDIPRLYSWTGWPDVHERKHDKAMTIYGNADYDLVAMSICRHCIELGRSIRKLIKVVVPHHLHFLSVLLG